MLRVTATNRTNFSVKECIWQFELNSLSVPLLDAQLFFLILILLTIEHCILIFLEGTLPS